jgi:MFS family permease
MNRDLLIVAVALSIWGIGEGLFFFFQPLYLQQLGANPIQIGEILSIVSVAMAVAHLPAGLLADRLGRKPMMLVAWLVGTATTLIMALATSLPLFVIGSTAYGLTSFVVGPMYSYVTAARGRWSVGRTLTTISATYNIGAVLGPLLGGWLSSQTGLRDNFFIAAGLFVVSSIMIFFIRPQPVERRPTKEKSPHLKINIRPSYLGFLILIAFTTFSLALPQPLSQNFMQNIRHLNWTQIGILIASRSLGIILLNLGLGRTNPRLGFLLAQGSMALGTIFLWWGTRLPTYMLGYLLMGSYQTARLLAQAQGRQFVDSANMGLGYGIVESVIAIAAILAPLLAGRLYNLRPEWIYSFSFALILIGMAVAAVLLPRTPPESVQGEAELA